VSSVSSNLSFQIGEFVAFACGARSEDSIVIQFRVRKYRAVFGR